MRRFQVCCLAFAATTLALVSASQAEAQFVQRRLASPAPSVLHAGDDTPAEPKLICTVYPLADFGTDTELGNWIVEHLPRLVEPASWTDNGGMGTLSYYPQGKVLVVSHTPAVHTRVEAFLSNFKKALRPASASAAPKKAPVTDSGVVPARYATAEAIPAADPAPLTNPYPVPYAKQQPKHLFHFIIRYEGEGVIDANVVKMIKAQAGEKTPTSAHLPPVSPVAPPGCSTPTQCQMLSPTAIPVPMMGPVPLSGSTVWVPVGPTGPEQPPTPQMSYSRR